MRLTSESESADFEISHPNPKIRKNHIRFITTLDCTLWHSPLLHIQQSANGRVCVSNPWLPVQGGSLNLLCQSAVAGTGEVCWCVQFQSFFRFSLFSREGGDEFLGTPSKFNLYTQAKLSAKFGTIGRHVTIC